MRADKRKRYLEELADMKLRKKGLEDDIKETEQALMEDQNCPTEYEAAAGKLKLKTRRNFSVPDNFKLIDQSIVTKSIFIQNAKMAPNEIKKIVGENAFDKLVQSGIVTEGKTSKFFELRS